ncbi:histidine kinase [Butyricicoccus sp.]|uniref:sensor histidine kinase n=1 Tax=Butyricicoccus sp. TaxID=2049021 RepID=UPI003F14EC6E
MRNSLQHRLLVYFLVVSLLPSVFFLSYYLFSAQKEAEQQLQEDQQILLDHAMEKIESRLTQVNEFVSWTLHEETINGLLERTETQAAVYNAENHLAAQMLQEQFAYRPITQCMLSFILLGKNGVELRGGTEAYLIDTKQIQQVIASQQNNQYWGGCIDNLTLLTENPTVIVYCRPVMHQENGAYIGDLVILFSPQLISEELTDLLALEDGMVALYNDSGDLMFSSGQEPKADAQSFSVHALSTGWTLTQTIETNVLNQQVKPILKSTLILAMTVIVLMIFLSIFLSQNLAAPINRMAMRIRRISEGDFSHLPEETVRNHDSEIEELDRRIQDMGDSIQMLLQQQEEKQKLELQMLQAQMNPHFLYNTLSSIRLMASLQGKSSVAEMIEALSCLLRANLSGSSDLIPLSEEIELLNSYLYIQDTRLKGRLRYRFEVPDDLKNKQVLKFILQPLAENSILHGIGNNPLGGEIVLHVWEKDAALWLELCDDGVGMDETTVQSLRNRLAYGDISDTKQAGHGIALRNVQARIQLRWGKTYGLQLDSALSKGTCVCLRLPLLTAENGEERKKDAASENSDC